VPDGPEASKIGATHAGRSDIVLAKTHLSQGLLVKAVIDLGQSLGMATTAERRPARDEPGRVRALR